jgi:hypothetical protein
MCVTAGAVVAWLLGGPPRAGLEGALTDVLAPRSTFGKVAPL